MSLVLLAMAVAFPAPANHYPACQDVCCLGNPDLQCSAGFGPRVITCAEYESVVPCY
ncbi:MAG TPA: hypothetical protein VMW27_29925 [Thermoanaerobaculia bacterium]|nr:hypothetical protein [Thermoanaerobaculia bacterium]